MDETTMRLMFLAAWVICGIGLVCVFFVKLERAPQRERRMHAKYEKLYDAECERNTELCGQVAELSGMVKNGDA